MALLSDLTKPPNLGVRSITIVEHVAAYAIRRKLATRSLLLPC